GPLRAARPRSLIQSVVQAGASRVSTRTAATPWPARVRSISWAISRIAGQPEYVGVMVTTQVSPSQATPRTTPRSTTDSTGISGSGTLSGQVRPGLAGTDAARFTTRLPDKRAAATASRPARSSGPRCAGPGGRPGGRHGRPRPG